MNFFPRAKHGLCLSFVAAFSLRSLDCVLFWFVWFGSETCQIVQRKALFVFGSILVGWDVGPFASITAAGLQEMLDLGIGRAAFFRRA